MLCLIKKPYCIISVVKRSDRWKSGLSGQRVRGEGLFVLLKVHYVFANTIVVRRNSGFLIDEANLS